jgi:hypothetical protein
VDGQRDEEHEEVAVVPAPDAVVHPRAVVVENLRKIASSVRIPASVHTRKGAT